MLCIPGITPKYTAKTMKIVILKISPIHSTSLEMSKVSSETDILLINVPQQTDAAIFL